MSWLKEVVNVPYELAAMLKEQLFMHSPPSLWNESLPFPLSKLR